MRGPALYGAVNCIKFHLDTGSQSEQWIDVTYQGTIVLPTETVFCRRLNFFEINFSEKFFQEYHLSVNQFGSRLLDLVHVHGSKL